MGGGGGKSRCPMPEGGEGGHRLPLDSLTNWGGVPASKQRAKTDCWALSKEVEGGLKEGGLR